MNVRWTPTASRDLQSIHAYIAKENPDAAPAAIARIVDATDALGRHAYMGRKGRVAGTRELVVPPYVVVYKLKRGGIEINAIIHSARRWPESL
jgi:addiction module RelE/StbE family toxin